MEIEKIGETIAYLRKRAGYTQKELADRIGISDKAVSKWERGQGLPDISYLRKLSILLDTNTDSLLAGNVTYHNNEWYGVLILDKNYYGINSGTIIYDKPLIFYLLSYFVLLGIKKISIVCRKEEQICISQIVGDGSEYGVQINFNNVIADINPEDSRNLMVVYGRCILYGVDQTRFFQRAMAEKDRFTILALPKRNGSVPKQLNASIINSNKPVKLRIQYDYSRLPIFFIPVDFFSKLISSSDISSFIDQNEAFVEMLDRGFVEFEIDDWNEVQDASAFIRIVQEKCGMNVYCIEEVAWRRGLISLEQLRNLGEKKKDTEYGAYILSLHERMKSG